MFKYKAKVLSVYDGDTMTLLIDVGFNMFIKEKVRLIGLDVPELRTKNLKEKKLGYEVRDYVRGKVLDKEVKVKTEKKGKFGRYLATVYYLQGDKYINLNTDLVKKGYARPYWGGKREGWEL